MTTRLGKWIWEDYESVSSTNDVGKALKLAAGEKYVITAQSQTSGRGRRGRSWISKKGNLFMSLVFEPDCALTELAFITSLSVAETIKSLDETAAVSLKWPNDVLLAGKKISGLLIETSENAVIIGVGVNITSAPETGDLIYPATCLKAEGVETTREMFLKKYLEFFEADRSLNKEEGFAPVREKWLRYAHHLGNKITLRQGKKEERGIFKGIDEQGFLLLEEDSSIKRISVGDVIE